MPEFNRGSQDCKKCTVENCEKCIGNKTLDFCIKCQKGFKPIYKNVIIEYCNNSNNDEFSVYNNTNESEICNDGYFLSFYNETKKNV